MILGSLCQTRVFQGSPTNAANPTTCLDPFGPRLDINSRLPQRQQEEQKRQEEHEQQWPDRWGDLAELSAVSLRTSTRNVASSSTGHAVAVTVAKIAESGGAETARQRGIAVEVA